MNPQAHTLWRAPQWAFSIVLALLGMLGPFSIDTYLPAFAGIAQSLAATPVQLQQTLSAYLFGFAFMSLFHGAISDSVGRKPVVLWGLATFTLASVGCALSQSISQLIFFRVVQGLSTGAGIVVARAIIRDMFAPSQAQKVMSQVTIFFGVAPAIAPMAGGWLLVHASWHAIFWFLSGVGVVLWVIIFRLLPETLHVDQRQAFHPKHLLAGYWQLGSDPRFLLLALASGIPFNGMFLYVLSAPVYLGDILGLQPQQFFWFFVLNIGGIMAGALISGRLAGKMAPKRQIRLGFVIMLVIGVVNLLANVLFTADVRWAMFPLVIFSLGWALMVPVVTLLVLDLHPERRGMASSLQMFVSSTANGIVAGVVSPLVMHSAVALAVTSLLLMGLGLFSWLYIRYRWPDIGQRVVSGGV
jgi:DHA1 family bicyclomycin/chloramphenicol resistance-like MFS transporter